MKRKDNETVENKMKKEKDIIRKHFQGKTKIYIIPNSMERK